MVIVIVGGLAESLIKFRGALMKRMVSRGHSVVACAPNASAEVRNELGYMGVEYVDVMIDRIGINPFKDLFTILRLIVIFRKYNPEIFLGYSIKPVIYGAIAARIVRGTKVFCMIEGLNYALVGNDNKLSAIGVIVKNLLRISLSVSDKIVFLNKDDLMMFKAARLVTVDQAVIIDGIGVDLEKFFPVPFPKNITFLMICRFLTDKGIREYAEAARVIRMRHSNAKFILVGWFDRGNPMSVSEQEVEQWIKSGAIESWGKLSDVRGALASSSVFVLPSYHEGMPVTVMEAMAMGRPVITTDAPGCRETVLHGKNGFLIPVKDIEALVNAIESFINNPDKIRQMGATSRRIAEERFDVHKINESIFRIMGI